MLQGLRPNSAVLMGKNTMMKRCIRLYNERTGSEAWAPLLDALVGNVGLVFTKSELTEVHTLTAPVSIVCSPRLLMLTTQS